MRKALEDGALNQILREARTYNAWLDKPVSDETLGELYNLMKWGPTSANSTPARFVLLRTKAAKERLRPALSPGNVEKTMSAPVTVIVAYDLRFWDKLPRLAPQNPAFRDLFANNPELAEATAKRNGTLQGAYLILALRAQGLDCGPMSGFDAAKVDAAFFPDGRYRSNFLLNIGYGERAHLRPRLPRLGFAEVACWA